MKNILFISGHTDLNNSVANKTILEELNKLVPDAECAYLDQLYPDFKIDVKQEQERLLRADVIVFQFPLFWYSIPSILQRWIEQTFIHGFSHGSSGDKLKGKKLILSFTSGAPESAYQNEDKQTQPLDELLQPYKRTASLCGLEWIDYIYTGGVSYTNRQDEEKLKEMKQKAILHAHRLIEKLKTL